MMDPRGIIVGVVVAVAIVVIIIIIVIITVTVLIVVKKRKKRKIINTFKDINFIFAWILHACILIGTIIYNMCS